MIHRIAPITIKKIQYCRSCGSTDVLTDAWASWDAEAGKFVLNATFDHCHCPECDRETKVLEIEFTKGIAATDFSYFTVAPCGDDTEDSFRTTPSKALFWTIYGVQKDGLTTGLHDTLDAKNAALALRAMAETLNLPITYHSETHQETPQGSLSDLGDHLAKIIHDEIQRCEDGADGLSEDFENHPLNALRHPITQIKEAG